VHWKLAAIAFAIGGTSGVAVHQAAVPDPVLDFSATCSFALDAGWSPVAQAAQPDASTPDAATEVAVRPIEPAIPVTPSEAPKKPRREPPAPPLPPEPPSAEPVLELDAGTAPSVPAPAQEAKRAMDERLARERGIVETARTALGRGKLEDARRALERHRAEFPSGMLLEEREALVIQLLVAEGRIPEAREAAERFRGDYPRSILRPAIEAAIRSQE